MFFINFWGLLKESLPTNGGQHASIAQEAQ